MVARVVPDRLRLFRPHADTDSRAGGAQHVRHRPSASRESDPRRQAQATTRAEAEERKRQAGLAQDVMPSSIIRYAGQGAAGKVTVGLASHWTCVTSVVSSAIRYWSRDDDAVRLGRKP